MDPNANLAEQRRIIAKLLGPESHEADLERLADLAAALDRWLTLGGFLPDAWRTNSAR